MKFDLTVTFGVIIHLTTVLVGIWAGVRAVINKLGMIDANLSDLNHGIKNLKDDVQGNHQAFVDHTKEDDRRFERLADQIGTTQKSILDTMAKISPPGKAR